MSFEQTFAFSASCSFMNLDSIATTTTTITISCGGSLRFLKTTHIAVFLGSSIMTQELNLVMEYLKFLDIDLQ